MMQLYCFIKAQHPCYITDNKKKRYKKNKHLFLSLNKSQKIIQVQYLEAATSSSSVAQSSGQTLVFLYKKEKKRQGH